MGPIRPFAAGRGHEAGFTLTELLVVLAIIGLLITATPVLIQSALPGMRSLAATRTLADDLRQARGLAISRGMTTRVSFDTAHQVYIVDPGHRRHSLPDAVPFSLPDGRTAIDFLPDGSSSGGIVFIGEGAHRHRISSDWASGRIAVDE
jgi:general secretion pathway protein H